MNEQPKRDYSRCRVLVPFHRSIEHDCDNLLRQLERLGPEVVRLPGCSAIDFARSDMASRALMEGCESILFIDSDMVFKPEDALYMFDRPGHVVGGLYSQKGYGRFCCNLPSRVTQVLRGPEGIDHASYGVGAGFLRISCEALGLLVHRLDLKCCTYHGGIMFPFFCPMVVEEHGQWAYLGEDYAFCRRCRDAGISVILDPRPVLYHVGPYWWGVEHAGMQKPERPVELYLNHRTEQEDKGGLA